MTADNEKMQKSMVNRLARIEGQVRGVQKLVKEGADCEKVMQQMTAARKAMDKAFYEMLACVIEQEVLMGGEDKANPEDSMARVKKLLTKYA